MIDKTMFTVSRIAVLYVTLAFVALVSLGCGGGNETTVVQPGADYQLTPEEEKMKAEIDAVPEPNT